MAVRSVTVLPSPPRPCVDLCGVGLRGRIRPQQTASLARRLALAATAAAVVVGVGAAAVTTSVLGFRSVHFVTHQSFDFAFD